MIHLRTFFFFLRANNSVTKKFFVLVFGADAERSEVP